MSENNRNTEYSVLEHLKLIENIINRMANNCFLIKGWTITLIAGLFAFIYEKNGSVDDVFIILLGMIVVFFGLLDSYYLSIERGYRELYKKAVGDTCNREYSLDLNENNCNKSLCSAIFSQSILFFYLIFFFGLLLYFILSCFCKSV